MLPAAILSRLHALLYTIVFSSIFLAHSAEAKALMIEVTPQTLDTGSYLFKITPNTQPDGTINFCVVVTEKSSKFPQKFDTSLNRVIASPQSASISGMQKMPSEKQDHSITVNFSVPKEALENPELCFLFTTYNETHKEVGLVGVDFYYARLTDFVARAQK